MLSRARISRIKSLSQKKFRRECGEFIAEGPKIAGELLDSNMEITGLYALAGWIRAHDAKLAEKKVSVQEVSEKELGRISNLKTPNEVVVTLKYHDDHTLPEPLPEIMVVLDGVQDPGNMGTIIRTADWFNYPLIVCSEDSADLYNPKVIQATMGSFIRTRVIYRDLPSFFEEYDKLKVYGTFAEGEPVYTAQLETPAAILIGNESKGIRPMAEKYVTGKVAIPSPHDSAESLNASVAAGIFMSEFHRKIRHG